MTLVQVIDAGNGKNPELKMTKSEILFSNVDSFKVIDPVSFGFRRNRRKPAKTSKLAKPEKPA